MFEINKGAQPPTRKRTGLAETMRALEPGDEMLIDMADVKNEHAMRSSVYQTARRLGIRVTLTKIKGTLSAYRVA